MNAYASWGAEGRGFGTTGNSTTRKLEIAAYLAQISHETSGGWGSAPDGRFSWGLYYIEEVAPHRNYCECIAEWPCYPGKSYKGRGPLQLSWNYKYGPAGKALWFDGLANPEVVASDSVVAFKTALWFWMTEQKPFNEFSYI
ncbi:chitinase 10 [Prunus yedoensis var. nudiflora]|uniref:Chitinase 10 n=1 Tax=Prunus yedoensis var. nudiflora TaxID=2094558 RepID=A0A314Z190_PRUYE|nr:chitinase 10 [Prunus yedoensis var. nudiflora]